MARDVKSVYTGNVNDTDGRQLVLNIRTTAQRGYAQTTASVAFRKDEGNGFVSEQHAVFSDFFTTVNKHPAKRVTQKVLDASHEDALNILPDIKQRVEQQYGKQNWNR